MTFWTFFQIKHGSDLWHQDENHLTPLTAAILNEKAKYVDLILNSFGGQEEENPALILNSSEHTGVNPDLILNSFQDKEENPELNLTSFQAKEVNQDLNSFQVKEEEHPDFKSSEHKEDIPDQNRSLKRYVNLRAKNYSPLMIAAAKPVYPILIRLLECGADPNERSKYGLQIYLF